MSHTNGRFINWSPSKFQSKSQEGDNVVPGTLSGEARLADTQLNVHAETTDAHGSSYSDSWPNFSTNTESTTALQLTQNYISEPKQLALSAQENLNPGLVHGCHGVSATGGENYVQQRADVGYINPNYATNFHAPSLSATHNAGENMSMFYGAMPGYVNQMPITGTNQDPTFQGHLAYTQPPMGGPSTSNFDAAFLAPNTCASTPTLCRRCYLRSVGLSLIEMATQERHEGCRTPNSYQ